MGIKKELLWGYALLFIGHTLLLTQHNVPVMIAVFIILFGHILLLFFGKTWIGLHKIIGVNFFLGGTLVGYDLLLGRYSWGLVHNLAIACILWMSAMYLQSKNKSS